MAQNTITLAQAQAWATKWRSNPANTVKAFLIPENDVTQLLQEPGIANIRAYLGVDEQGTQKLMLVGVNGDGRDMISDADGQNIYDFTLPCPSNCDETSPLYTLK
jgi:hypothetical protein